jgi:ubiquinone/menaquinone biosynthesis C-methylase UbiE
MTLGRGFGSCYCRKVMPVLLHAVTAKLPIDRSALLSESWGDVLEVGCGSGVSLPFFPPGIRSWTGVEPTEDMLAFAQNRQAKRTQPFPCFWIKGQAEHLPFPSERFDTVILSLVLCSVRDPHQAVAEVHRVLRPKGRVYFFEHVRSESTKVAFWQDHLNPLWRRLSCGCHMNRQTHETLQQAGFAHFSLERQKAPALGVLFREVIRGWAEKA